MSPVYVLLFFFSSRRRHTRCLSDWSSDVCSSDLSGTAKLLILSQVVLSLQLSFAVFPLVWFTSDRLKMGEFVNPTWVKALAYVVAVVIAGLNVWLLAQTVRGWLA